MTGPHLLAVDGGNTKTIAIVVDSTGAVKGAGRGACSDSYYTETPDNAVAEIVSTATTAMAEAGVTAGDLSVAVFSLAGADWPEDFAFLRERLGAAIPAADGVVVVNDAIGALWAGTDDGAGAAAACGTYAAFSAGTGEEFWHTSFFSEPAGGFHLATAALRAVCRAALGSARPTALRERLLKETGLDREEALLHRYTHRARPARAEIARLAPAVLEVAAAGDPVARELVSDIADGIETSLVAAALKVGLSPISPIVLTGGLFRHPSSVLAERVVDRFPYAEIRVVTGEPVAGAALMAARLAGFDLTRDALTEPVSEALGQSNGRMEVDAWR